MSISVELPSLRVCRLPLDLSDKKRLSKPCVVTIGNFDGVHRGHQSLLQQAKNLAAELGAEPAVMLFEPQPLEFFSEAPPLRVMRLEEKIRAIADFGIKTFFIQSFGADFAALGPEQFARRLADLGVCSVVIGDDFRYGKGAKGDVETLLASGKSLGFSVWQSPAVVYNGTRVSSSRIRAALADNDLQQAVTLLGHPVRFWGRVGYGDQLGRQLGFPTANLVHKRDHLPLRGVYSAHVQWSGGQSVKAVCNLGIRPTVNGLQARFEVHLLDASVDLYGQKIRVTIRDFIRGEQKFDGLEALKSQIKKDVETTEMLLNQSTANT